METLTAVGAVVAACTGLVAAGASLWNVYQFSILRQPVVKAPRRTETGVAPG